LLRTLEDLLLRAEAALAAGVDPGPLQSAVERHLASLDREHDSQRDALQHPEAKPSLARERARRGLLDAGKGPDLSEGDVRSKYLDLQALADKVQAAPKPDDKDKERLQADKKALLKQFQGKPYGPFELAWLVFNELCESLQPQPGQVRLAVELLKEVPPYEEVRFVRRLGQLAADPKLDKAWPGQAVAVALQLVRTAAVAEARADDGRLLPWVRHQRKAAAAAGRPALELLFDPKDATAEEVRKELTAALGGYTDLESQLKQVADAFRARDDALVRLPGFARYLEDKPRAEREGWAEAVRATRDLRAALTPPENAKAEGKDTRAAAAAAIVKLDNLTETLQGIMTRRLEKDVKAEADKLIGTSDKAGPSDWVKMNALLRVAWLPAGKRAELWEAARKVSARLTRDVLDKDAKDEAEDRQTPAPGTVLASKEGRERALARAEVSLDLLSLHPGAKLKEVRKALEQAKAPTAGPEVWHALGEQLRRVWSQVRPAPAATAENF
jgi:hypothetical protein